MSVLDSPAASAKLGHGVRSPALWFGEDKYNVVLLPDLRLSSSTISETVTSPVLVTVTVYSIRSPTPDSPSPSSISLSCLVTLIDANRSVSTTVGS